MPRENRHIETHLAFDQYANAFTVIQEQHRMLHDGYMFHASGQVADLASDGSFVFLFVTPEKCYPHMQKIMFFLEDGPMEIQVYEGATVSDNGTELVPKNLNRNSSIEARAQLFHSPTSSADGELIHDRYFPGVGKDTGLIGGGLGEEWVFKPLTSYLFRLTNNTGGIVDFGFEGTWYEIGTSDEY